MENQVNHVWLVGCFSWVHVRGPNFCNWESHCFTWVHFIFYFILFFQKMVTKANPAQSRTIHSVYTVIIYIVYRQKTCHHTLWQCFNIPVKRWRYWGMFVVVVKICWKDVCTAITLVCGLWNRWSFVFTPIFPRGSARLTFRL